MLLREPNIQSMINGFFLSEGVCDVIRAYAGLVIAIRQDPKHGPITNHTEGGHMGDVR